VRNFALLLYIRKLKKLACNSSIDFTIRPGHSASDTALDRLSYMKMIGIVKNVTLCTCIGRIDFSKSSSVACGKKEMDFHLPPTPQGGWV